MSLRSVASCMAAKGLVKPRTNATEEESGLIRISCPKERFAQVNAILAANSVTVSELTPARQTLEEFFLSQ